MSTNTNYTDWEPKSLDEAETLYDVAHARAGNKHDICNIGLIPYDETVYSKLKQIATEEKVKEHFGDMVAGEVERYCVDSVASFNFVLHEALDGGWAHSNRIDKSGKSYSQYLLRLPIDE